LLNNTIVKTQKTPSLLTVNKSSDLHNSNGPTTSNANQTQTNWKM